MSATATNEVRPSLHHVTMKTSHLDEMIKWYGLVVGTQVQFRNETAAWTTNDGANHRIAFLAVPAFPMMPTRYATTGCTTAHLNTATLLN